MAGPLASRTPYKAEDVLRNELIGQTVRGAKSGSAFYRDHFAGLDLLAVRCVEDLAALPMITKADVRTAGALMLCDGQTPSHVQNTSGSTGTPLLLYRSQEEVAFIRAFFGHLHEDARVDCPRPIVLALTIPHHGTPTPIPGNAFVLQTAITDNELLEQSIVLLETIFSLQGVASRVSAIVGSFSQILVLTNYLIENGRADIAEPIKHIELTGDYLTPRWREVLSLFWRCPIVNRYSLAEIFGGATYCQRCCSYHFDPHVVPELVRIRRDGATQPGEIGELVLTSLNPFVQYQPFIRYFSGDLFVRRDTGCFQESWHFRGRASHALIDPRDPSRVLIDGRAVMDAIDTLPAVARPVRYSDLTSVRHMRASGSPVFSGTFYVNDGRLRACLQIELTYTPALFPDFSNDIVQTVREAILANAPAMKEAIRRGDASFDVECVPPGEIPRLRKVTRVWERFSSSSS